MWHSGTFSRTFACDLGFTACEIFWPKGPCGTTFWLKIQYYPPKSPCGTLFWFKIQLYPYKKPLTGRFSGSKYVVLYPKGSCGTISWPSKYQNICFLVPFRLWYIYIYIYMKSEAFRYKKSFEHSPKPSKHENYTAFYDFYSENCKNDKRMSNIFWPVLNM